MGGEESNTYFQGRNLERRQTNTVGFGDPRVVFSRSKIYARDMGRLLLMM
jgi:hypothetical protein